MQDCLVLVERGGVQSTDIVTAVFKKGLYAALHRVKKYCPEELDECLAKSKQPPETLNSKTLELNELEVSLTSIVLATSLDRQGIDFALIDDEDIVNKYADLLESYINDSLRYVLISTTYLSEIKTLINLIDFFYARDPSIKIMVGGQVLYLWEDSVFEKLNHVYCYFYGDMDIELGNVMAALLRSEHPDAMVVKTLPDGKRFYTVTNHIENLDETCLPDWGLLKTAEINNYYYQTHDYLGRIPVEERRGCPHRCAFCSYRTLNKHRQKSSERIVQELIALQKLGYRKIYFVGSEFLAPVSKSRKTFELLAQENLELDILCYARLDLLAANPDMVELMARVGVKFVYFGVESGDQSILKNMNKNYNLEKIPGVVKLLKDAQISIWASFIFGFPGETAETIKNTTNFIINANFNNIEFHALQVVPDTPLYINRDKYQLKLLGNFWFHPTMSLKDLPEYARQVYTDIYPHCDSFVQNINDHISKYIMLNHFSNDLSKKITKYIQKLIYIELSDSIVDKDAEVLKIWDEMRPYIYSLPESFLSL